MYKLHYDVESGDQLNVVYKGVEFEIQAGEGEGGDIESNKEVTITENGTVEITPSIDKDAMAKVTATVNVPTGPDVNVQDFKSYEVTTSGVHSIYPDSGYDAMEFVQLDVSVPSADIESNKSVTITQNGTVEIIPSIDKDAMAKVTATVNVPVSPFGYPIVYPQAGSHYNEVYIDLARGGLFFGISDSGYDAPQFRFVYKAGTQITFPYLIAPNLEIQLPVFPYEGGYEFMYLHRAWMKGGDQSNYPVKEFRADRFYVDEDLIIGTQTSTHARYEVYRDFTLRADLTLNGADLYIYTLYINISDDKRIMDGLDDNGVIHVYTTYPYDTLGEHAVVKDLVPLFGETI